MKNFDEYEFSSLIDYEFITKALCPCCQSEWEIYFDGLFTEVDESQEQELINNGFLTSQCEDCYYESFFTENIDDGKYTPVDVYGIGGLVR